MRVVGRNETRARADMRRGTCRCAPRKGSAWRRLLCAYSPAFTHASTQEELLDGAAGGSMCNLETLIGLGVGLLVLCRAMYRHSICAVKNGRRGRRSSRAGGKNPAHIEHQWLSFWCHINGTTGVAPARLIKVAPMWRTRLGRQLITAEQLECARAALTSRTCGAGFAVRDGRHIASCAADLSVRFRSWTGGPCREHLSWLLVASAIYVYE